LSYYCCTGSTPWHLQKSFQYILVKLASLLIKRDLAHASLPLLPSHSWRWRYMARNFLRRGKFHWLPRLLYSPVDIHVTIFSKHILILMFVRVIFHEKCWGQKYEKREHKICTSSWVSTFPPLRIFATWVLNQVCPWKMIMNYLNYSQSCCKSVSPCPVFDSEGREL
jgi:hypothetical protein